MIVLIVFGIVTLAYFVGMICHMFGIDTPRIQPGDIIWVNLENPMTADVLAVQRRGKIGVNCRASLCNVRTSDGRAITLWVNDMDKA